MLILSYPFMRCRTDLYQKKKKIGIVYNNEPFGWQSLQKVVVVSLFVCFRPERIENDHRELCYVLRH